MDLIGINIIPSKSIAHRAYICEYLSGGDGSGIVCNLDSDDINATRNCLEALRSDMSELDCGESGSTLRFILPLAGASGREHFIKTKGRLSSRPMEPFESELRRHGMKISHQSDGIIEVSGKLESGTFNLPGSISSQFITGLLLTLPSLDGDSKIVLTSKLQSRAYVDITVSVLADYGVNISEHDGMYEIPGSQKYEHEGAYKVEGDWSQAAFWLVMGLIGKAPVKISGLRNDSKQGDREIIEILRRMGGKIVDDGGSLTAYPSKLTGAVTDISQIPDLAPAIAAASCAAEGVSKIVNAGRLRLKESDRIESIVKCVSEMGFDVQSSDDEIVIKGADANFSSEENTDEEVKVDTANDHRIVMMAAVLSLISKDKIVINGSSAVSKSYPTFFDEMDKAGLSYNVIRN